MSKALNRPMNRRELQAKPIRGPGILISRTTRGVSYKAVRSVFAANQNNNVPRWG